MVMTPQRFYSNIGDRFGATEGRSNPHRGQDHPWGAGTEIPAFRDLLYLATYYHSGLGNVALSQGSDGVLVGFSHLLRPCEWKRGQVIRFGEVVGLVGNTGSLSRGNHLHLTASLSSWEPWAGPWIDPLSYVMNSLNGIAVGGGAGGGAAAAPAPVAPLTLSIGEEMRLIRQAQQGYKFNGKQTYGAIALVGPGFVNPQESVTVVNILAKLYGVPLELTGDEYHTVIRECLANDPKAV